MNVLLRIARSPLGLVTSVVVGIGLTLAAVHSVFLTEATEVSPQQAAAPAERVGLDPGSVAPPVSAAAYAGRGTLTLAAFRGHPVVLNFWASWCPPCRAEVPALEGAYLRYRTRGLVVFGVDAQSDTWGGSELFLRQHGATYPAGRDLQGTIARTYRIADLPTTYFIDAGGRVVGSPVMGGFTGADGAQDLDQDIRSVLH